MDMWEWLCGADDVDGVGYDAGFVEGIGIEV